MRPRYRSNASECFPVGRRPKPPALALLTGIPGKRPLKEDEPPPDIPLALTIFRPNERREMIWSRNAIHSALPFRRDLQMTPVPRITIPVTIPLLSHLRM